ncbi:hypothetical protein AWC38_SpisGene12150 [Stylophora pistillata]|uniref:Uncharacterized protein n=1 Tax=Stylophora pistillata TaxID=50429 RepID=A0A2B4S3Y5_STYPI|nr:hypothetical protein AWC38_SpisGene12150 [Stylophora pistillata]
MYSHPFIWNALTSSNRYSLTERRSLETVLVKQTIDEQQNKLIQKLDENQKAITQDLSFLKELDSSIAADSPPDSPTALEAPSKPKTKVPDPNIGFTEDELEYIQKSGFPPPNDAYKRILAKDFDHDRLQIDLIDKIKRANHVKAGLSKNKEKNRDKIDNIVRQIDTLKKYADRINLLSGGEKILVTQEGKGHSKRKYTQKKRNAYKIENNGQFGGLLINPTRLINEMIVEATSPSTGSVVHEKRGDRSLIDLLTKRFNPKINYSQKSMDIFKDLTKLANLPMHKTSGKAKMTGGVIFTDFNDLKDRLIKLTGTIDAGNTSIQPRNERMGRDANGKIIIQNIDEDYSLQEGEGIFDALKSVAAKVTGKAAKELATKAATKALEKGAEQIGEKTGQLLGEKIYDKFTTRSAEVTPQVTPREPPRVAPEVTPSREALELLQGEVKKDKGDQLVKLLQKESARKTPSSPSVRSTSTKSTSTKTKNKKEPSGYEFRSYELDTPLQSAPANNTYQQKDSYKFTVDTSTASETVPDWYNAYFEMDVKLTKMDNTTYGAADAAAIINGGFSLIEDIKISFDSTRVLDLPNANHAVNVKNLTEMTDEHARKVGPRQFFYKDTATGAVIQKYTTLQLTGDAQNIAPTDNAAYNEGFAKRKTLLAAGAENNIHLPLNRFGFFHSMEEQLAPNGRVSFDVRLESDDNVLFRSNAAAAGRYIVTKFKLWVPFIKFNELGVKAYMGNYLKPHTWTYLKEQIVFSNPLRQGSGTFRISNAVRRPRL